MYVCMYHHNINLALFSNHESTENERNISIRAVSTEFDRQPSLLDKGIYSLYSGRVYFDKRRTGVGFWSTVYGTAPAPKPVCHRFQSWV